MRRHSRSKNGVAWLAYVPRIHIFTDSKAWMGDERGHEKAGLRCIMPFVAPHA